MSRELVMVFLKFPEVGKVKTRLAAEIGDEAATEAYRRMVGTVLQRIPDHQEVRICYDPPERGLEMKEWIEGGLERKGAEFRAQCGGDLGERLEAGFAEAFADGYERVAAIGGDCVDLGEAEYQESWELLRGGFDVVYGPSLDGGYYLIAMRKLQPVLFEGIPWSSKETLEKSLIAAKAEALEVSILKPFSDVDTLVDWQQARDSLL